MTLSEVTFAFLLAGVLLITFSGVFRSSVDRPVYGGVHIPAAICVVVSAILFIIGVAS